MPAGCNCGPNNTLARALGCHYLCPGTAVIASQLPLPSCKALLFRIVIKWRYIKWASFTYLQTPSHPRRRVAYIALTTSRGYKGGAINSSMLKTCKDIKTDRTWFSRLLRHPARKRSGSIRRTPEPSVREHVPHTGRLHLSFSKTHRGRPAARAPPSNLANTTYQYFPTPNTYSRWRCSRLTR